MNRLSDAVINFLLAALAGGMIVIPIAWGIAKSMLRKRQADSDKAAAQAELDALKVQNALAEERKLTAALVLGAEAITAKSCDECEPGAPCTSCKAEAGKSRAVLTAYAEAVDVGPALKATVEGLGLSSASRAEITSPAEDAKP